MSNDDRMAKHVSEGLRSYDVKTERFGIVTITF